MRHYYLKINNNFKIVSRKRFFETKHYYESKDEVHYVQKDHCSRSKFDLYYIVYQGGNDIDLMGVSIPDTTYVSTKYLIERLGDF